MAIQKGKYISDLPANTSLDGTELIELQKGVNVDSSQKLSLSELDVLFATAEQGQTADTAVQSVVAGSNISVDSTNPHNPVVSTPAVLTSVVAGSNILINNADPRNPIINASGGGGGGGGNQSLLTAAIMELSPKLYYKCDETSGTTLADSSGNGADATLRGTNILNQTQLIEDGGGIFSPPASSTNGAVRAGLGGLVVPFNYDYTAFGILLDYNAAVSSGSFVLFACETTGSTASANAQLELGISYNGQGLAAINFLWQYGTRSNEVGSGSIIPKGIPTLAGIRKNTASKSVDYIINGRVVYTHTYVNEPAGGTSDNVYIATVSAGTTPGGIVSNVTFFDKALTNDNLKSIAQAAGLW